MIRSLSLFHLTLAALLVKNPKLIADQSIIMVLGGSMQLVWTVFLSNQAHVLTLVAYTTRLRYTLRSCSLHRYPVRVHRYQRPHRSLAPYRGLR